MLYPLATEALFSATYVDNYIESVDAVPEDIQQLITSIRNIDVQFRNLLRDVDHYYDLVRALPTSEANPEARKTKRQRALQRMHQALIRAQEMGDEKMRLVNHMQELIDYKSRQLETSRDNLDIREDLQQINLQQIQQQGNVVITTAKHLHAQGPMLIDEVLGETCATTTAANAERILVMGGKEINYPGYNVNAGNTTSNMDVSVQMASNSLNLMSGDAGRGNNKRSRRRNETVNDFDTTSASEVGSIMLSAAGMSERPGTSRSLSANSLKKGSVQISGNMVSAMAGNNAGSGATVGNSNAAGNSGSAGKKKKRKAGGRQASIQSQMQTNAREDTPPVEAIDPDEPTYCICNQISFGEMILCDNDLCPIEWFHFSCVSLVLKPKGKWYCPNCRGDRPNVMKPKAQFLKELEKYNKEKEEKT